MARRLITFLSPIVFIFFAACGGGDEPPPNVKDKDDEALLKKKADEAVAACCGAATTYASTFSSSLPFAPRQIPGTFQCPPAPNLDACENAFKNFHMMFTTLEGGQYANTPEAQQWYELQLMRIGECAGGNMGLDASNIHANLYWVVPMGQCFSIYATQEIGVNFSGINQYIPPGNYPVVVVGPSSTATLSDGSPPYPYPPSSSPFPNPYPKPYPPVPGPYPALPPGTGGSTLPPSTNLPPWIVDLNQCLYDPLCVF